MGVAEGQAGYPFLEHQHKMATQTEVVTVRDGEDQANPDTIPEQNDSSGPKESGLRRRFKKKNGPKTRKPPGRSETPWTPRQASPQKLILLL